MPKLVLWIRVWIFSLSHCLVQANKCEILLLDFIRSYWGLFISLKLVHVLSDCAAITLEMFGLPLFSLIPGQSVASDFWFFLIFFFFGNTRIQCVLSAAVVQIRYSKNLNVEMGIKASCVMFVLCCHSQIVLTSDSWRSWRRTVAISECHYSFVERNRGRLEIM